MELSRIKILVDKYFDGLTSLEEEQELARYFAQAEDIPEEYQAVKMMLGAFDALSKETPKSDVKVDVKAKRNNIFRPKIKWVAGVAAAVVTLIGVAITLTPSGETINVPAEPTPAYVCYVNGVKVEDDKLAYAEASRILGNVSEDVQLAMAEVNRLTHYTLIK